MERILDLHLEKLKKRVLKMCSIVDEQVELAIKSINEEDLVLAQTVIDRDDKVDKYDLKIDKICQRIFALTQPVAMDLRYIMSALTINNNLERVGDLAADLAESMIRLEKKPVFLNSTKLPQMFTLAKQMVKDSIDAYLNNDAELARKVIEEDDKMDALNNNNHEILENIMKENCDHIRSGITLLVMSRHLERLADHTTNIAEDVFFVVEAQMVKHKYEKYLFTDDDEDDDE